MYFKAQVVELINENMDSPGLRGMEIIALLEELIQEIDFPIPADYYLDN